MNNINLYGTKGPYLLKLKSSIVLAEGSLLSFRGITYRVADVSYEVLENLEEDGGNQLEVDIQLESLDET